MIMLFYIVTYDITSDKRRQKISDILEGYGQRVQYSVFECILHQKKYHELRKRLKKLFENEEDSIRFYPVSQHTLSQVETWGGLPVTKEANSIII
jgi:CRISPR-associated protein Cas2